MRWLRTIAASFTEDRFLLWIFAALFSLEIITCRLTLPPAECKSTCKLAAFSQHTHTEKWLVKIYTARCQAESYNPTEKLHNWKWESDYIMMLRDRKTNHHPGCPQLLHILVFISLKRANRNSHFQRTNQVSLWIFKESRSCIIWKRKQKEIKGMLTISNLMGLS